MILLKDREIEYADGIPFEAELCKVTHIQPHSHDNSLEILLVLQGSVELISNHERLRLSEGDFFSLDPCDIHAVSSNEDSLLLQFHLDICSDAIQWNHVENLMFACQSSLCRPHLYEELMRVKDCILSLSFLYLNRIVPARKKGVSPDICGYETALNTLLDTLYTHFNWFSYNNTENFDPDIHDRLYRIYSYCVDHMYEKVTIPDLAEYVHLSRNYLSQFMKKTSFGSFSNMLQYIRCYEAERLMLKTKLSNADISLRCGFSDTKYFYAAFSSRWGSTPAVFRRMMRNLLNTPEQVKEATPDEAAEIMERYVLQWHLDKTTKMPSQLF